MQKPVEKQLDSVLLMAQNDKRLLTYYRRMECPVNRDFRFKF